MSRYKIHREDEDEPKEFDDKEEFESIKSLLDENGVEYTAEVPESELEDHVDEDASDDEEEKRADGSGELVAKPTPEADKVDNADEFVTEIAGVPPAFVMSMGSGKSEKPFVTKEGLTYLAAQQGLQVRAEPVKPGWEDHDYVVWKGVVENSVGETWEDYGTARKGSETIGDENIDELCSTRATNRALRLATGCGMTSFEEMPEGSDNVVDEQGTPGEAETVEAEVVN